MVLEVSVLTEGEEEAIATGAEERKLLLLLLMGDSSLPRWSEREGFGGERGSAYLDEEKGEEESLVGRARH
jgi:hypothetical protein